MPFERHNLEFGREKSGCNTSLLMYHYERDTNQFGHKT